MGSFVLQLKWIFFTSLRNYFGEQNNHGSHGVLASSFKRSRSLSCEMVLKPVKVNVINDKNFYTYISHIKRHFEVSKSQGLSKWNCNFQYSCIIQRDTRLFSLHGLLLPRRKAHFQSAKITMQMSMTMVVDTP